MTGTEPETLTDILILNALDYPKREIAEEVGVSESTVSKYTNAFERQAKASGEPRRVFAYYLARGAVLQEIASGVGWEPE